MTDDSDIVSSENYVTKIELFGTEYSFYYKDIANWMFVNE